MNSKAKSLKHDSHYNDMMLALLPLILCATVLYSSRVLLICAVAFVTARIVDVAMAVLRRQDVDMDDKSATVAALTFCMMLPVSIPLYVVVMTVAIVTLVGKHAFGGKEAYPFSLAALSMCVAAVNWPEEVFKAVKPFTQVDFWTGQARSATSVSYQIKTGGLPYISTFDLLLGNHAGAVGSSFIIIIAAIGVFLLVSRRITWHIPVTFIATCSVIALAFPRIYGVSRLYSLKYEILTSAVIFYAVFMLNEPATTPKNPKAKTVFGIVCGVMTMLFRYFGSFEIGGCFALLLVNATEGYWDRLFDKETSAADSEDKETVKAAAEVKVAEAEKANNKKVYKKEEKHTEKPKAKDEKQPADKKPKRESAVTSTLDIISRAEDDIDQVEFSTQTIDVRDALRAFEEKYNKGGK